jgi:hypothetical protein
MLAAPLFGVYSFGAYFHISTWMGCKSAKIMVLQIHKKFSYSISCSKAEKEIGLLQDRGHIKKRKGHRSHGPRTIQNICHLSDHFRPAYLLIGPYL